MKRVLGALLVACMCIALGLSVNRSREAGISLAQYPYRVKTNAKGNK